MMKQREVTLVGRVCDPPLGLREGKLVRIGQSNGLRFENDKDIAPTVAERSHEAMRAAILVEVEPEPRRHLAGC